MFRAIMILWEAGILMAWRVLCLLYICDDDEECASCLLSPFQRPASRFSRPLSCLIDTNHNNDCIAVLNTTAAVFSSSNSFSTRSNRRCVARLTDGAAATQICSLLTSVRSNLVNFCQGLSYYSGFSKTGERQPTGLWSSRSFQFFLEHLGTSAISYRGTLTSILLGIY